MKIKVTSRKTGQTVEVVKKEAPRKTPGSRYT